MLFSMRGWDEPMMISKMLRSVCAAMALGLCSATWAGTVTLGFDKITNNGAPNATSQFTVTVTDDATEVPVGVVIPTGAVAFLFNNTGSITSSITDIYFQDGTLLAWAAAPLVGSDGVAFNTGASPKNLPGGQNITPAFRATMNFAVDSASPTYHNGINPGEPGEWLAAVIVLKKGANFTAVYEALMGPYEPNKGMLRIGIHVQGFVNGQSESYISKYAPTDPTFGGSVVPLPASLWAGAALLAGLGLIKWHGHYRRTT